MTMIYASSSHFCHMNLNIQKKNSSDKLFNSEKILLYSISEESLLTTPTLASLAKKQAD